MIDLGAVPNDVSPNVIKELGVTLEVFNHVVTVANGARAGALGKLNDFP